MQKLQGLIFETKNLVVRKLTLNDFEDFHEMQSDPLVMQYTSGVPLTRSENWLDLERVIQAYSAPANPLRVWAIGRKATEIFLGTCALVRENQQRFEIGIRINQKNWGKGVAHETLLGLICHAFNQKGVQEIIAYAAQENIRSVRLLKKFLDCMGACYNEEMKTEDYFFRTTRNDFLQKAFSSIA